MPPSAIRDWHQSAKSISVQKPSASMVVAVLFTGSYSRSCRLRLPPIHPFVLPTTFR
jgi:hypothetical protein